MKIKKTKGPIDTKSKYWAHIEEMKKGYTLNDLEPRLYKGIRQACYKQELAPDTYRVVTRKRSNGLYDMCLIKQ